MAFNTQLRVTKCLRKLVHLHQAQVFTLGLNSIDELSEVGKELQFWLYLFIAAQEYQLTCHVFCIRWIFYSIVLILWYIKDKLRRRLIHRATFYRLLIRQLLWPDKLNAFLTHNTTKILTLWLFWPHWQSSNLLIAHIDSFNKLLTQIIPQSLDDCFSVHLQLVQLDPLQHLIELTSHRRAQPTLSDSLASL